MGEREEKNIPIDIYTAPRRIEDIYPPMSGPGSGFPRRNIVIGIGSVNKRIMRRNSNEPKNLAMTI